MNAIDLFAGAGGFTHGARMAGLQVAWAANHWPTAMHLLGNAVPPPLAAAVLRALRAKL